MAGIRQRFSAQAAAPDAWRAALAVSPLALLGVMALALMHPVLSDFGGRVLGWPSDNVLYAYATGWMARAPIQGALPFVDPHLNFPDGLRVMANDMPYLGMLAVAPVTLLLGPVAGYNALILLAHLLSGAFTYLWVRRLTGSALGGLVAGLAFMLAPYRVARSYGHLNLVSTYPLPLFFWALDGALRRPPSARRALLLAGATFLVGAASQYYLLICLVTGAVYALLAILGARGTLFDKAVPDGAARQASSSKLLAPVLGAALAGALVSALPYLEVLRSGEFTPYSPEEARRWSASPANFLAPPHLHPIWGETVARLRPETLWMEKTLYVGAVAGVLALVALAWLGSPHARICRVWAGTALAAAVLALGTDLHIGNTPLQPDNPVWLPAYYLGQLPLMGLVRVWARFGVVTILFVTLLAGVGAALLAQRWERPKAGQQRSVVGGRRSVVAQWSLVLLLLLDLLPGRMESYALGPRRVDAWLAQQPGDFAVGFQPHIDDLMNYRVLFGSLTNGKRAPAFAHIGHLPAAFRDYNERARGFPDEESARRLRELGLRYIILERPLFDGRRAFAWREVEARLAETPSLYVVAELGETVVLGFREGGR